MTLKATFVVGLADFNERLNLIANLIVGLALDRAGFLECGAHKALISQLLRRLLDLFSGWLGRIIAEIISKLGSIVNAHAEQVNERRHVRVEATIGIVNVFSCVIHAVLQRKHLRAISLVLEVCTLAVLGPLLDEFLPRLQIKRKKKIKLVLTELQSVSQQQKASHDPAVKSQLHGLKLVLAL